MWGGWSTSWKRVSNQRRLVPQERVAAAGVAAHAKRRAPVYAAGLCRRSCGPSARSQAVGRPAPAMATTGENPHRTGASADETLDRAGHHAADHPDSAFLEEDVRVRLAATRFTRPSRLCSYLTVKSLSTWAATMVGVPVSRGRPRRQDDRLFSSGSPGPRCGAAIPSVDGAVINGHASLGHHRFDVTQAQRVGCVPARQPASPPTDKASAPSPWAAPRSSASFRRPSRLKLPARPSAREPYKRMRGGGDGSDRHHLPVPVKSPWKRARRVAARLPDLP